MFNEAPVIFAYTRAQALKDGFLIDVTELAGKAGFGVPVAVTTALFSEVVHTQEGIEHQEEQRRLSDVLNFCRLAALTQRSQAAEIYFNTLIKNGQLEKVRLKAVYGPDDDASPCVTIMLPDED